MTTEKEKIKELCKKVGSDEKFIKKIAKIYDVPQEFWEQVANSVDRQIEAGKSEAVKVMEEVIYNYPPEFLLECEYEANARDVLNDIVQRIKFKIGELAK